MRRTDPPDIIDHAVIAYDRFRAGDETGAEQAYARLLPSASFAMQSIESLVCYGKRVFALRAGLAVHDRAPALKPTQFGLDRAAQHATALGPLPGPAR